MTESGRHPHVQLLDRIIAAAEAGDATDLFSIYADDAVIWHNHDNREQTVAENAVVLEKMHTWVRDRSYDDRRIQVFDGGVVQRRRDRGGNVAVGDEAQRGAGGADFLDELGLARTGASLAQGSP